jgi:ketosteroid isomerase-like protein
MKKTSVYLAVYLILGISLAFAQGKNEEGNLKNIAQAFIETYGRFTQNKDKQSVLNFMSEKVTAMLVNTNIQGTVQPFTGDYAGLIAYMDKLLSVDDVTLEYKLTKIARVAVVGEIGTVLYDAEYKIEKDGNYWSKGFETVYLVFKKENNNWKIIHYTTLTMEDEKLRGDCYCEFFISSAKGYIARTIIPSGKNYDAKLNTFLFNESLITVDSKEYEWRDKKAVYVKGSSTANEGLLGDAKTEEEAIAVILKQAIYTANCAEIKIRKKGKK